MRKGRDPHWCRHDQSYRRGKQQAHASNWKLTRQVRPSEHQGRRHAVEVTRLSSDIEARKRTDRRAVLIAQMHKDRQWLLGQIAACPSSRRDDWLRKLDQIEPTASGAEAALGELRDDIERERRKLASATPARVVAAVRSRARRTLLADPRHLESATVAPWLGGDCVRAARTRTRTWKHTVRGARAPWRRLSRA